MKTFQEYAAVLGWYDGDTFYGAVDHGGGIFRAQGISVTDGKICLEPVRCRCAIINAFEKKEPKGLDALHYAEFLAPPGIYPCITYKKDDEFDRPLIDLILPSGQMFSDAMLAAGLAVVYH